MGLPRRSPANRRELLRAVVLVEAKCRELGSRWQTIRRTGGTKIAHSRGPWTGPGLRVELVPQ
jgi:hypothetical protein